MQSSVPIVKDLVFVGGGHTHALVLRRWGMRPVPGVRLTLINPGVTAPYSGMLPGHIAGHYTRGALDIDLVRLARFGGVGLIVDRAVGLDPEVKIVRLSQGREICYDLVSLDVGITANMPNLPGFAEHGVPAKPLGRFADIWAQHCAGSGPIRIVILGGGVAGCEVAMAAMYRMGKLNREVSVTIVDQGRLLSSSVRAARERLMGALIEQGVDVIEGASPSYVEKNAVILKDGRIIASDLTIGTAGATPHPWIAESGLPCRDGFLEVDEYLRSVADPTVYAAGDCAHLVHDPRPKAGVYAVRAAPFLTHNLRADLTDLKRKAFYPQRDFLKLISLGGKSALAEKAGFARSGDVLWRWKNRIDQRFMDQFRTLPEMPRETTPKGAARGVAMAMEGPAPCGGCGSKIGSDALKTLLNARPGDDAAVLKMGRQTLVLSTDHLRGFALDPGLVAQVAAVHALGDIWAMGARPQVALAQVILPRAMPRLQGRWLDEVMDAARAVFEAEGVKIVGGHSTAGMELTIGFAVTGLVKDAPVTLGGAKPGDELILTKPLGTGVIMAAEMRAKADGEDVLACWQSMVQPSGDAAHALTPVAHAMTDVTGFGLAGHLGNICAASGVGAEIDLMALPVLSGAKDLSALGIRSSLWAQNHAGVPVDGATGARGDLLFDPQTAGGLLAAIPADEVNALLSELPQAWRIGRITEAPGLRAV